MTRFRICLNELEFQRSDFSITDEHYFDLWGTFEFCLTGRVLNREDARPNLQNDSIIERTDQAGLQYTFRGPRGLCDTFLTRIQTFPAAFAKIKSISCDDPYEVVYLKDPASKPMSY